MMGKPSDLAQALTSLWVSSYGPAADLVGFLKNHPDDPRSIDVPLIEPLLKAFHERFLEHDLAGVTLVATKLDRVMFKCNARKLGPLVKVGETFTGGRKKKTDLLTQVIDDALTRLGKGASTEDVRREIKKKSHCFC